jgi:hypothetical protein
MSVALVSGAYPRREVVARGVSHKLNGETVQPFSCVEDALASSLVYDAYVVYNNFEKKMNGLDGVREIRRRAPAAYIVGVSSLPYMERRFLPAGADAFVLLAGNEIAELSDVLLRRQARSGNGAAPAAPIEQPAPAHRPQQTHSDCDQLVYTLERARLLLDYALNNPDPDDLRRYGRPLMLEIERVLADYYSAHPHDGP